MPHDSTPEEITPRHHHARHYPQVYQHEPANLQENVAGSFPERYYNDTARVVGLSVGDRTTCKHRNRLERVELSREQQTTWKRQRRTRDALPKQAQRIVEDGQALIKEAKGLGKS